MKKLVTICAVVSLFVVSPWASQSAFAAEPIVAWGNDNYGQVSGTPIDANYVALAANESSSYALRPDGSIAAWGKDSDGQVSGTPTGTGYTAVVANGYFSTALAADGSIAVWGEDSYNQITDAPNDTGYIAVGPGVYHASAVASDGSLVSWGNDEYGVVSGTPDDVNYVAVDSGFQFSIALKSDGSITAWGRDSAGQVSDAPTGTGYTAIAAGEHHGLALKNDGSLIAWGRDVDGQVSGTPTTGTYVAISGGAHWSIALKADGSIAAWGKDNAGQVSGIPAGTGITAIMAGYDHGLALGHQLAASIPYPSDYAGNVPVDDVVLSWSPGEFAANVNGHRVYFSADFDDVNDRLEDANQGLYTAPEFDTADLGYPLEYSTNYYWAIDEVNDPNIWPGNVWRFTTTDFTYLIVDDFEDYSNRNTLRAVWTDGCLYPAAGTSGSNVTASTNPGGTALPGPVRSGNEAMRYNYDNDGYTFVAGYPGYPYTAPYYSEAVANTTGLNSLDIGKDWTRFGIKALTLYFYGDPDNDVNDAEWMYVALDDGTNVAVVEYDGDPNDLRQEQWQVWGIELAAFTGVNLANVEKLYIGFGDRASHPDPGGSGVVYFDDIELYPTRCFNPIPATQGDVNDDCKVNFLDFAALANGWGNRGLWP